MSFTNSGRRSVLQRRSSLSNTLQASLDGLAILGISYFLIKLHIGMLTSDYIIMLMMLMGLVGFVYDHYGIYRSHGSLSAKALKLLKAWTISFALLLAVAFLAKMADIYSRLLVGELYVLGFFAQVILHGSVRWVQIGFLKHAYSPENVIILGSGRLANYLYQKVSNNPWLGQKVVGAVKLDGLQELASELDPHKAAPILGDLSDLNRLIEEHEISTVYFVTPLDASDVLETLYFGLLDQHVAVHWIPDIFSLRLVNHSVREIAGIPVLTLSETPLTGTRLLLKQIEDMVLSGVILLLILPVLAAVALAIKLDSPGPVFFRQNRMGWNGKTFRIWKFRSMVVHQPEGGQVVQAQKNDSRITRVGAFIRKTSLDELPQLFNVLQGDMSLVGPRPHAIQHDEEYSRRIADYFARHRIKPGITGLAQVRGYRGETKDIEQMVQRVEADIEYINNWSVWLDLSILLRTTTAFTGAHAY